jgi:hypothetical protein
MVISPEKIRFLTPRPRAAAPFFAQAAIALERAVLFAFSGGEVDAPS